MTSKFGDLVFGYIDRARSETNMDERIIMLDAINSLLPVAMRVKLPSLITNDYIDATLNKIEEEISAHSFVVAEDRTNSLFSRSAPNYHYSLHSDENIKKEIDCECGNIITYNDVQFNCDFPEYRILECGNCGRTHKIIADGKLVNICGAV